MPTLARRPQWDARMVGLLERFSMRSRLLVISAIGLLSALTPITAAHAQIGGGNGAGPGPGPQGPGGDPEADAKKRRLDREMQTLALPLPAETAAGPCPYVKVLYDAARSISFKDNKQASAQVVWSGEIQGLIADCSYLGTDPIKVRTNITFTFGRGPQATGDKASFSYWIAVTDRDKAVLDKQYFTVQATFPAGSDRVTEIQKISNIQIPRASANVRGDNFEVLIGFDVTPEQAAFNRSGSRFRPNAVGEAATASAAGTPAAR
jgi:hypothetical protein